MDREPLRHEHLERFEMREHEQKNMPSNYLDLICNHAVADALIGKDGEVVAILGYFILWNGVAEVFVVPSKSVCDYAVMFVWHVRKELDRIMIDHNLRRIHSNSLADDRTDRWMKLLGFQKEGTMKGYAANGDDYNVWARFA